MVVCSWPPQSDIMDPCCAEAGLIEATKTSNQDKVAKKDKTNPTSRHELKVVSSSNCHRASGRRKGFGVEHDSESRGGRRWERKKASVRFRMEVESGGNAVGRWRQMDWPV